MKHLLLSTLLLVVLLTNATTYTSVMNGNWSSPYTWGQTTVIPLPGDDVIINHTVTLDDQFTVGGYWSVDAGSITIGANGILQAGANVLGIAIQNNGTITNNGHFNMPQLGNYTGSFINNGTCSFTQLIFNADYIENNGNIFDLDSVLTTGQFINNSTCEFHTDSLWIEGIFTNHGSMYLHEITNNGTFTNNSFMEFRRMTNLDHFDNIGFITGQIDMTNAGYMKMWIGSTLNLTNNFLNADTTNHSALLLMEGTINIGNNILNLDTIKGVDGEINVQDSSMNAGWFKGSFIFCDATPPSSSPFIDYNIGTIESSVRYCTSESIENIFDKTLVIYPNPATQFITINKNNITLNINDITGKLVLKAQNKTTIDISKLKPGVYFVSIENFTESGVQKLIVK
ncbi:MAG: T9SS type A sorting domain-containing protein [Bacteroidales bacterium]|nr:T9SS type A sorting domain-containing protein [Bacteroidales bacterium]